SRLVPGASGLHDRAARRTGLTKTLLLGAASGLAGFCSGPILGAVLTLAAAQGDLLLAGALLAVYAAGMVVPLLGLTWAWTRMSDRSRRALRGRTFTVLGRELHTTSVVTGLLLIGVGVLFWATNGLLTAPALVPTGVQMWLQERSALLSGPVVDIVVIVLVAAAILLVWARRGRRRPPAAEHPDETADRARSSDSGSSRGCRAARSPWPGWRCRRPCWGRAPGNRGRPSTARRSSSSTCSASRNRTVTRFRRPPPRTCGCPTRSTRSPWWNHPGRPRPCRSWAVCSWPRQSPRAPWSSGRSTPKGPCSGGPSGHPAVPGSC